LAATPSDPIALDFINSIAPNKTPVNNRSPRIVGLKNGIPAPRQVNNPEISFAYIGLAVQAKKLVIKKKLKELSKETDTNLSVLTFLRKNNPKRMIKPNAKKVPVMYGDHHTIPSTSGYHDLKIVLLSTISLINKARNGIKKTRYFLEIYAPPNKAMPVIGATLAG